MATGCLRWFERKHCKYQIGREIHISYDIKEVPPKRVINPLPPVFDEASRILILGTMPSPKSRSAGFYYSHPQNRFWKVLAAVTGKEIPSEPDGKKRFLLQNKIAMWDVLSECDIDHADDASIRRPVANDMSVVFDKAQIRAVFTTGKKAFELYKRYCMNEGNTREPRYLPSTSPANCGNYPLDRLIEEYKVILEQLD